MTDQPTWTILGSGGGEVVAERAGSGYLLETGFESILFDCGDGVVGSFLRAGKEWDEIGVIFLSHTHPDHICGLTLLLQQLYLARREEELVIYLPGEAIAGIKAYCALSYLPVKRLPFKVEFRSLINLPTVVRNNWVIRPHGNSHLLSQRGQPWLADFDNQGESYSFEVRTEERKIVYSADIGTLDDLNFCGGADLLLVETTHVRLSDLFQRAQKLQIKKLILSHIGPQFDAEQVSKAGEFFSGEVQVAHDGMVIPL